MSSESHVITVLMGLGHIRAAYPLKKITGSYPLIYGSRAVTPSREYRLWKRIRNNYYFISRAGDIPLIGNLLMSPMRALQKIPPYYPVKDYSHPNLAVRYLDRLIRRKGLCRALIHQMRGKKACFIHTFYATAIAMDMESEKNWKNYLLITDSDFNRVWVPADPSRSRITYFAPNTQVKNRLVTYGIKEKQIHVTGFPLPRENIGPPDSLEILKRDLWKRLLRLDPRNKFFSFHRPSVLHWLKQKEIPGNRENHFSLMFAIGGSGVQCSMASGIIKSLKDKIRAGALHLYLSAGIQPRVFHQLTAIIHRHDLQSCLQRTLFVIFHRDVYSYLDAFNSALRKTDVLWTKPSELSFYCALGLPILLAPPVGTHEKLNARWLSEIHSGLKPPGPVEATHQWLWDLRENGRLAEAAWDGFLKSRKLGTHTIRECIRKDGFQDVLHPMKQ